MQILKPQWVSHDGTYLNVFISFSHTHQRFEFSTLFILVLFSFVLPGLPIFCIDIHPDNSRFVTGGQGKPGILIVLLNSTHFSILLSCILLFRYRFRPGGYLEFWYCIEWSFWIRWKYTENVMSNRQSLRCKIQIIKLLSACRWISNSRFCSFVACVNCVRWSNSGKYLASGGDDKLVMIWSFAKYPQGNLQL